MTVITSPAPVAQAYDSLAPYYDRFTDGYAYEPWLTAIEQHAIELGLSGWRALDLGCGTGKSSDPLLARGYSVVGCDISEAMVREAQRKFPEYADSFFVADMRELPWLGEFDLVVCLDDAINYLLSEEDLEAAFEQVATVLAPGGVFAFDANSLLAYRTAFAQTFVREAEGMFSVWRGEGDTEAEPGGTATATVEIFDRVAGDAWKRSSARHVQRHHPPEAITAALGRAGLECAAICGQYAGARLVEDFDEDVHIKLVYFAKHEDDEWR